MRGVVECVLSTLVKLFVVFGVVGFLHFDPLAVVRWDDDGGAVAQDEVD